MSEPSPEMPRFPESAPLAEREITVPVLSAECVELAVEDPRYARQEKLTRGRSARWTTSEDVAFEVKWDTMRVIQDGQEVTHRSILELDIVYEMVSNHLPRELKELMNDEGDEIPEPETVASVAVNFTAQYTVTQHGGFGRHITRTYVVSVEEAPDEDPTPDKNGLIHADYRLDEYSKMLDYATSAEFETEPDSAEAAPDADDTLDMLRGFEDQIHLRDAQVVLEMLQFEDEGDFDLSNALPAEAVEEIMQLRGKKDGNA